MQTETAVRAILDREREEIAAMLDELAMVEANNANASDDDWSEAYSEAKNEAYLNAARLVRERGAK